MSCNHDACTSRFCPQCGAAIAADRASPQALLIHLRGQIKQRKKEVLYVEELQKKYSAERPENAAWYAERLAARHAAVKKWTAWADWLEKTIVKGTKP